MAASTVVTDYLAHGTLASRPASLSLASGAIGLYFCDDTLDTYAWNGSAWTKVNSGGGGGSGGLWSQVLSTLPTSSGTGLTTWNNQGGSSVVDGTTGIILTVDNATATIRARTKAVPATPYTITALLSSSVFGSGVAALGWTDGTKFHFIGIWQNGGWGVVVQKYTNVSTFSANDFSSTTIGAPVMWLQIRDDGTNVKFRAGSAGSNGNNSDMVEVFSVAKASGFLGSSGYTNIAVLGQTSSGLGKPLVGVHSWNVGS